MNLCRDLYVRSSSLLVDLSAILQASSTADSGPRQQTRFAVTYSSIPL
jgi:hypothetical protein